ncbi:MAG TPA: cytochrome c [Gemmataceae bacterium]
MSIALRGRLPALFGLLALFAGCGDPYHPGVPPPDAYPVRSDWLVVSAPKVQPSRLDDPGYPPLLLLSRPRDTFSPDTLNLYREVESNNILDARNLPAAQRRQFARVLTAHFGGPTSPRVELAAGPGAKRLDDLIRLLEKGAPTEEQASAFYAHVEDQLWREDLPLFLLETAQEGREGLLEKARAFRKRLESEEALLEQVRDALRLDPGTLAAGGTVYRRHCMDCHGLTGDGNGPGGRWLVPHPRDYRQGVFKFVSSDPAVAIGKPRRADLARTVTHGMDGAGMTSFAALAPEEVDAVVSYVTHLSLRGECEFETMKLALDRRFGLPDLTEIEGVVWGSPVEKVVHENLVALAPIWLAAEENPVVRDPDPYVTEEQRLRAAAEGHRIFNDPKLGTCTTCHVNYGRNPLLSYDVWGTVAVPRDLTTGTLRGGRSPEDLYLRVNIGIAGAGMPGFRDTLKPNEEQRAKGEHPLWQVVHFLRALPDPAKRRALREEYDIEIE